MSLAKVICEPTFTVHHCITPLYEDINNSVSLEGTTGCTRIVTFFCLYFMAILSRDKCIRSPCSNAGPDGS